MPGRLPDRIRELPRFEGDFDAFEVRGEGCRVLVAEYPAGATIPLHEHETENCGVITSGELILEIGGEEQRFASGDWYAIPAGVKHAARFEVPTREIEFWFEPRS